MNSRVASESLDADGQIIGSCRTDGHSGSVTPVPVKAELRAAEFRRSDVSRTNETDLFLNGPEESQWRVRQFVLQQRQRCMQDDSCASPVITPEGGVSPA